MGLKKKLFQFIYIKGLLTIKYGIGIHEDENSD